MIVVLPESVVMGEIGNVEELLACSEASLI